MRRPSLCFYVALFLFLYWTSSCTLFVEGFLVAVSAAFIIRHVLAKYALSDPPAKAAILITGCSSGFGRMFALRLAARGVLVFAGVRSKTDGENLILQSKSDANHSSENIVPLMLDVTKDDQISKAVDSVRQVFAQRRGEGYGLYAIVNNAGVLSVDPVEIMPMRKIQQSFEVNTMGPIKITRAFLPLLREWNRQPQQPRASSSSSTSSTSSSPVNSGSRSTQAKVVFISSVLALGSVPFLSVYSATKQAVEAIADGFRFELAPQNIRVSILQPGGFATNLSSSYRETRLDQTTSAFLDKRKPASPASSPSLSRSTQEFYSVAYARFLDGVIGQLGSLPEASPVYRALCSVLFCRLPAPVRVLVGLDACLMALCCLLLPDSVLGWVVSLYFWGTQQ